MHQDIVMINALQDLKKTGMNSLLVLKIKK